MSQGDGLEQIKREIAEARHRRAAAASEAQEARARLGEIMRRQFQQWQLTRGEQEVALLLLKGLGLLKKLRRECPAPDQCRAATPSPPG